MRSHPTCPKCAGEFDFDYAPGVSFTSIRLAGRRYMACPLCHRWSQFDLESTLVPE